MSSKKSVPLVSMAVLCGALLSLAFVNPHNGQITLAELVLQLSGSRGDLPLGTSLPELLSFSIKMAPYFLFELYIGVYLYRHFCTASVYVFSRTIHRTRWYIKECLKICGAGILYQVALIGTVIVITCCRYDVAWWGGLGVDSPFRALWFMVICHGGVGQYPVHTFGQRRRIYYCAGGAGCTYYTFGIAKKQLFSAVCCVEDQPDSTFGSELAVVTHRGTKYTARGIAAPRLALLYNDYCVFDINRRGNSG